MRDPLSATREEMEAAFPTVYYTVDWGRPKRQGKRSGGMVMGAMGDPPRGVKRYRNKLAQFSLHESDSLEINSLDDWEFERYWRARTVGMNHNDALIYSYDIA